MYKMIKRTKPCHCRYKQHTPCDMSLYEMYSCRVPFDNDRQWSCYLMISNRFVHVKWGKSDNFWLKREKDMIPTTSTHCENRRTERTDGEDGRRGRTDAQRLAALRWPRFTFGEFYLIDSPPFIFIPLKNASFWPFFLSFPKSMFFCRVSTIVLSINDCHPDFGTVPVLPPCFSVRDLFPNDQFNSVYWTKPKQ